MPFLPRGFFGNASVYLPANQFHIFWCKNLEQIWLPRGSVYQKVKCLGRVVTTRPAKYQFLQEIETKFQWLPHVLGVELSNEIDRNAVRPNRGSGKSKMAASKPEVPISRPVENDFRGYINVFEVGLSIRTIKNIVRPNRKWEFQDGGLQTGSMIISPCIHYRNTSPTAIPMFSASATRRD